jgi:hypothetical protein
MCGKILEDVCARVITPSKMRAALFLLVVVVAAATACSVPCVRPPRYWSAHPSSPAWVAATSQTLLDVSWAEVLDERVPTGYTAEEIVAAGNVVAAALSAAQFNCSLLEAGVVGNATLALLEAFSLGPDGTRRFPTEEAAYLATWVSGRAEGGPCACSALSCARYIAPQTVIDRFVVATDELTSASVGFLVWAIVATVVAVALAVAFTWYGVRGRRPTATATHTPLDPVTGEAMVPLMTVGDVKAAAAAVRL